MINLREAKHSDAEFIIQQLNNSAVTKYLTPRVPSPYTESDAEEWINVISKQNFYKAIEYKGDFVGVISVERGEFEAIYSGKMGYWLGEPYWGLGIITQAISKMTEYIFTETEIVRITAAVFSPNIASMKALEKNGYELEAVLKSAAFKNGKFYDEHLFSKINL